MFASLSVSALITRARTLSDKRGSQFMNDTEIEALIQDSFDMLFMELVEAREGYFTTQTEPAIPTNKNQIAFPADLYKVRLVEKAEGDNCNYPLRERTLREVSGVTGAYFDYSSYSSTIPFGYVIFNNHLKLYPADGVAGTKFRLTYARDPLAVGNEKLQKGWEKYLAYKTAYTMTCIEDNPRVSLGDLAKEWQDKIKDWASQRDTGPRTVTDLDGRHGGGLGMTFY